MRRRSINEKMDDNRTGSFGFFCLPLEGFLPHALGVPLSLNYAYVLHLNDCDKYT